VIKVNLKEAQNDLEHLVEEASGGEEVIITRGDGAGFRIVPVRTESNAVHIKPEIIGNSLDRYMGVWSAEEADEFLKAVEVFEEIDESLWS
jgi:antitoxin (DNA-binding transcriptional repressor) of toxin-antitoxin stability system